MNCNNCNILIENKYSFAIKNNQCPACGKHIMKPEKLASYTRLQELIKNNFVEVDSEKLANLVLANFEIKQLFKEGNLNNEDTDTVVEVTKDTNAVVEVTEDDVKLSDEEYDAIHKAKQIGEAKKLKNMREDAYKGALMSQYGMGEEADGPDVTGSGEFFNDENTNTVELVDRIEQSQKQNYSQSGMLSGVGGFSRSDV